VTACRLFLAQRSWLASRCWRRINFIAGSRYWRAVSGRDTQFAEGWSASLGLPIECTMGNLSCGRRSLADASLSPSAAYAAEARYCLIIFRAQGWRWKRCADYAQLTEAAEYSGCNSLLWVWRDHWPLRQLHGPSGPNALCQALASRYLSEVFLRFCGLAIVFFQYYCCISCAGLLQHCVRAGSAFTRLRLVQNLDVPIWQQPGAILAAA